MQGSVQRSSNWERTLELKYPGSWGAIAAIPLEVSSLSALSQWPNLCLIRCCTIVFLYSG